MSDAAFHVDRRKAHETSPEKPSPLRNQVAFSPIGMDDLFQTSPWTKKVRFDEEQVRNNAPHDLDKEEPPDPPISPPPSPTPKPRKRRRSSSSYGNKKKARGSDQSTKKSRQDSDVYVAKTKPAVLKTAGSDRPKRERKPSQKLIDNTRLVLIDKGAEEAGRLAAEARAKVFGNNHLPVRRPETKSQRLVEKLIEEAGSRSMEAIPTPEDAETMITFRDTYTDIGFSIFRNEIPERYLAVVTAAEEQEDKAGLHETTVDFDCATPAAVWLFVQYLRFGRVFENHAGWALIVAAYPQLAEDSYLNGLLAGISMARDMEDTEFEQALLEQLDLVVKESLGPLPDE